MALLTIEAEYMVVVEASKEIIKLAIWQEQFLLHCDNQSVIHISKNVAYHSKTKHIHRRYHWIRETVEERVFTLVKIHTDDNGSDMLKKVLSTDKLSACR